MSFDRLRVKYSKAHRGTMRWDWTWPQVYTRPSAAFHWTSCILWFNSIHAWNQPNENGMSNTIECNKKAYTIKQAVPRTNKLVFGSSNTVGSLVASSQPNAQEPENEMFGCDSEWITVTDGPMRSLFKGLISIIHILKAFIPLFTTCSLPEFCHHSSVVLLFRPNDSHLN